jgi:hypothetical protein
MKCPNCGSMNPGDTRRCDCGYDFLTGIIDDPHQPPKDRSPPRSTEDKSSHEAGSKVSGYGCLILALFLLVFGGYGAMKEFGGAVQGDAGSMGYVCRAFFPGVLALIIALKLLRENR